MKIKKYAFFSCKMMVVLLTLVGCVTPVSTLPPQPSATLSPTFLPSPSLTETPSSTPVPMPSTPTSVPTLSPVQEQRMKESLQAGGCKLPCYLGITPGKTTLSEARTILENLGASYRGEYKRKLDDGIEYPYAFVVSGRAGMDETPRPDGSIVAIYHSVSLITNNDIVQIIQVGAGTAGPGVSTENSIEKFREYWSRYMAREIFLQMGPPDQIYADVIDPQWPPNGRTLFMVYEKRGAVIELYGTGRENNICPQGSEAHFINLRLSLYDPNTKLSIYSNGRTSKDLGMPIEEAIGVNTKEFYNRVVSDPSVCFEPKVATP